MAGLKSFAHLETLGSDDLNSYVMSQLVPRFISTSARNAAIPSPSDGMLCHVAGQGFLAHDGSGWTALVPDAPTVTPETVTGSRADGTALASLLTGLATLGLIIDSTTA